MSRNLIFILSFSNEQLFWDIYKRKEGLAFCTYPNELTSAWARWAKRQKQRNTTPNNPEDQKTNLQQPNQNQTTRKKNLNKPKSQTTKI